MGKEHRREAYLNWGGRVGATYFNLGGGGKLVDILFGKVGWI